MSRSITPTYRPIRLGGYAVDSRASAVDTEIEVNCLFLSDGQESVLLATLDLLYVTHELRQAVLSRVWDLGLTDDNVFLAASHTHYAPAIDTTKPGLGIPEPRFLEEAIDTIVDAIRDSALGPKSRVTLATASGSTSIGTNRRRRRLLRLVKGRIEVNQVGMGPNPKGETDAIVSVIEVRSDGAGPLAFIWSGSCHPTARGQAHLVSADWPGVVRGRLRELAQATAPSRAETPVLFFQGFSGDVRPPSGQKSRRSAKELLLRMMLGPGFKPMNSSEYLQWASSAANEVASIATACVAETCEARLVCARIELSASRFAIGAEHLPPVSFHRVSIGPVTFAGASAELVSGYALKVREMARDKTVIPVGCIDHVIGYWPLQHMLREGGYEVQHHCPSFGIEACAPDIETIVLEQFRSLLSDSHALNS